MGPGKPTQGRCPHPGNGLVACPCIRGHGIPSAVAAWQGICASTVSRPSCEQQWSKGPGPPTIQEARHAPQTSQQTRPCSVRNPLPIGFPAGHRPLGFNHLMTGTLVGPENRGASSSLGKCVQEQCTQAILVCACQEKARKGRARSTAKGTGSTAKGQIHSKECVENVISLFLSTQQVLTG